MSRNTKTKSVLITDLLERRSVERADFESEKLALRDLAREMVARPEEVLPTLALRAMEETNAGSAGISLLEPADNGSDSLRWLHVAGKFAGHSGLTFPAGEESPTGICLLSAAPVLMARPEREFAHLAKLDGPIHEMLLVPFTVAGGQPSGALWVIHHQEGNEFDNGDVRIMSEFAAFAGLAVRMIQDAQALRDKEERLNLAFEHQSMLTHEMSHRVNNLFALISSMISLTARSAETVDAMAQGLSGRLRALSRAQNLFKRDVSKGTQPKEIATLEHLLEVIFEPFMEQGSSEIRLVLDGPSVEVSERAVISLSLVLHELATNAAKYGALSQPDGVVRISWRVGDTILTLNWNESGGPSISERPTTKGFGTILSAHTLTGQFDGSIAYDWKPHGLSAEITMSMERMLA